MTSLSFPEMPRGYLNALSFPAADLDSALEMLGELKAGIASLIKSHLVNLPIMCSLRAAELPLSPGYELLANGVSRQGGRFRDTVYFFLALLDQRSPAHIELDAQVQQDALNYVLDGFDQDLEAEKTQPLMACAIDAGVLFSIGSQELWKKDTVSFSALTVSRDEVRHFTCDNVCDFITAASVATRLEGSRQELVFDNWDYLSGNAGRSLQVVEWFAESRRTPGLEHLIMRSVKLAHATDYRIDGELIKKLKTDEEVTVFEIRAFFNGSNNVRLLFSREKGGRALFGFGGFKRAPDWYDHAVTQAVRHIKDMIDRS